MIILIDLNQLMIANILRNLDKPDGESVIRQKIISKIISIKRDYSEEYGDVVICCDSRSYWRRDYFPNYKLHRKEDRKNSEFDWDKIHSFFNIFKAEIKAYLPYHVIDVNGAEADDVIAVLVKHYSPKEKILIYSSDKDFMQLHIYPNVAQYCSLVKEFVTIDDPTAFLKEHIIRGDKGDGIPNILSDDDCIIEKRHQTRLKTSLVENWIYKEPESFCTFDMKPRYERNETLIDFDKIPDKVEKDILFEYENYKLNPRNKVLQYCIQFKLKKLTDELTEF